jgi:hypothetical protein
VTTIVKSRSQRTARWKKRIVEQKKRKGAECSGALNDKLRGTRTRDPTIFYGFERSSRVHLVLSLYELTTEFRLD